MDPLTRRDLLTLVILGCGAANAASIYVLPATEIHAAAAGFCLALAAVMLKERGRITRTRNDVLRRFIRPRFDEDNFGGWRRHDGDS